MGKKVVVEYMSSYMAAWCKPWCKNTSSKIEELAGMFNDISFYLVHTDTSPGLAQLKILRSKLVFHFFYDGELVRIVSGNRIDKVLKMLEEKVWEDRYFDNVVA